MKGKKFTYILLTGVCLIWGFAFYQLYTYLFKSEKIAEVAAERPIIQISADSVQDFTILANYRDPFLGALPKRKKKVIARKPVLRKKVQKTVKKKEPVKEPEVDLSFIKYIGIIKNQETGKKVSILSLNGKDYLISKGDSVKSVHLINNFKDSIEVKYKGKNYFITKGF